MNDTQAAIKNQVCNALKNINYVDKAYLFGSYARGEETPTSDVDIMVELNREMGLDFFELFEVFEKALDKKVDVLTRNEVYDIMPKSFERDKILLYERDS